MPSFVILEILGANVKAYAYQYREGKLKVTKEQLLPKIEQNE